MARQKNQPDPPIKVTWLQKLCNWLASPPQFKDFLIVILLSIALPIIILLIINTFTELLKNNKDFLESPVLVLLPGIIALISLIPSSDKYKKIMIFFTVFLTVTTMLIQIKVAKLNKIENQQKDSQINKLLVQQKQNQTETNDKFKENQTETNDKLNDNQDEINNNFDEQFREIDDLKRLVDYTSVLVNRMKNELTKSIDDLEQSDPQLKKITELIELVSGETGRVVGNTEDIKKAIDTLKESGLKSSIIEKLYNSVEALEILHKNKSQITNPTPKSSPIIVEYFPKKADEELNQEFLEKNIEDLGFTFELGQPKNNEPSNTIWFGKNVESQDVKDVFLTLVRAGVEIKAITPFEKPSDNNYFRIQIGATPGKLESCSPWTIEEIEKASQFTGEDRCHSY